MKTYRSYQPRQGFLLPPSPLDWLPEDHLALFLMDTVQELDLSAITAYYERERRGFPPHDPLMMVTLLLYAYCVGVPSSRKIEQRTHEDIGFRVVAGNTHPDHSCISEFRRIHLAALSGLFVQVLRLCQRMGLVKLGVVALDGTKLKANASKHKAMSLGRMNQAEQELQKKVQALLAEAEQTDSQEDATHGRGRRGDELPEELRRAQSRLERIQKAKAELLAEATAQQQEKQESAQEDAQVAAVLAERERIEVAQTLTEGASAAPSVPESSDEAKPPRGPGGLPRNRVPVGKDGQPTDKAQRNFTDPESRICKTQGGYVQSYNGQLVVDGGEHQIIVAQGLSNQSPDAEYFVPMMDRTIEGTQAVPKVGLADAGYLSERNLLGALSRGIDAYIAPGRMPHGMDNSSTETEADSRAKAEMKRKLSSPEGEAQYRRRKAIVEPVIGQIKNRGLGELLLRGLEKAEGEWALITLSHNLLKLHKARSRPASQPRPPCGVKPAVRNAPNTRRSPQIFRAARHFLRVSSHSTPTARAA